MTSGPIYALRSFNCWGQCIPRSQLLRRTGRASEHRRRTREGRVRLGCQRHGSPRVRPGQKPSSRSAIVLWRSASVRGITFQVSQTIGGPLPPDRDADAPPQQSEVAPPALPESPAPIEIPGQSIVPRTRTGVAWWALGFSMLLLILVLIFVLQNLSPASTSFFGVKWTIPLGLDLLLAALLGGVIAFLLGAARMLQLRRVARHYARSRRHE
jgi:uncharacterized integral membrane protein